MYDLQDEFQCLVEGSITQDKWRQEVAAAFSAYHLHKLKESVNGAVKINDVVKTSVSHLYLNVAPKYASFLFWLRAGDLELAIETGRHKGLARGERTCPLCEGGEVEDAVHFCLRCPRLAAARHALFTAVEAVVEPWSVEFGRWYKSLGHSVTFKGESAETVLLRHLMGEPMEGMPREMQSVVISRMAQGLHQMWVVRCDLVHGRGALSANLSSETATESLVVQDSQSARVHASNRKTGERK